MRLIGIDRQTLEAVATAWECELYNLKQQNKRGDCFTFQLKTYRPDYQRRKVRRNEYQERKGLLASRTSGPCFHIYRELVRLAFECGLKSIVTVVPGGTDKGGWTLPDKKRFASWEEFRRELEPGFGDCYVGSHYDQIYGDAPRYVDLCDHGDCFAEVA